jgi:sensor histidine kinase regulating citrate/malate metabolism
MLHEFRTTARVALIDRCRLMVAQRRAPKATGRELEHGITLFLDQLITTLRVDQTSEPKQSRKVSGVPGGGPLGLTICRHSVEANNGVLGVRDVPGSGCVFTIDLPRHGLS